MRIAAVMTGREVVYSYEDLAPHVKRIIGDGDAHGLHPVLDGDRRGPARETGGAGSSSAS